MIQALTFDFWDTLAADDSDEPKRAQMGLPSKADERVVLFVDHIMRRYPHIEPDDAALTANGEIDVLRFKPLARMGYRDYTCVERVFQLNQFTGREAGGIAHLQESVHV